MVHGQPAHAAQESVPGLGLSFDDVHREAQLGSELLHERGPVLRVPQGRRRHSDDPLRARADREGAEVSQRLPDVGDRLRAQPVLAVHVADEAEGGAAAGQDVELAGGVEAVPDHPGGVGADVDDRDAAGRAYGHRWPRRAASKAAWAAGRLSK